MSDEPPERLILRIEPTFDRWLSGLRDPIGRIAIARRLKRLAARDFGDSKHLSQGVHELRLHIGPGYRIYYTMHRDVLCVLLCAGDKLRQRADIQQAIALATKVRRALEDMPDE